MLALRLIAVVWNVLFPENDVKVVVKPPRWAESQYSMVFFAFAMPFALIAVALGARRELTLTPRNNNRRYGIVTLILLGIALLNWQLATILGIALLVSFIASRFVNK